MKAFVRAMLVAFLAASCGSRRAVPRPAVSEAPAPASALYGRALVPPKAASGDLSAALTDAVGALGRMTGSAFTIGPAGSTDSILLERASDAGVAPTDAARLAGAGPEAFVIRSADSHHLVLVANADAGLVHGLYYYLRELGCRWLLPGDDWTVVPKRADVTLKIDRMVKPAFRTRTFFATGGFGSPTPVDPGLSMQRRWTDWQRRNGFGGDLLTGGHTGEAFNTTHRPELEQHPEYLALVGGKRTPWSPGAKHCVSNPGLVKLYVADRLAALRAQLKKDPGGPASVAVSVEPADGSGFCECDRCHAIGTGSVSDQVFHLANEVAKAVSAELPGHLVSLYAYAEHAGIPTIPIERNVYVVVIPDAYQRTGMGAPALMRAWHEKVGPIGLYTYWVLPDGTMDSPVFDWLHTPAASLREWRAEGVEVVTLQTTAGAGAIGLGLYLASQLMWNVDTDVAHLTDEFFQLAFDRAALPMRRMLERWSGGFTQTEHEMALSFRDLMEARTRAEGDAAVLRRVDAFAQYVEYLRLLIEYQAAVPKSEERQDAARRLVAWLYASYDSGMVAAHRIRTLVADRYENDPRLRSDFDPKDRLAVGWRDARARREDMGALVRARVAALRPLDLSIRQYSSVLAPLVKPDGPPPSEWTAPMRFVGSTDFELEAPMGAAAVDGDIAVYRGSASPGDEVSVVGPGGDLVFRQMMAADGVAHRFTFPVSSPGRYHLHVEDQKNVFQVRFPTDLAMAVRSFASPDPSPRLYFFVPKGLRRIAMYVPSVIPVELADGDGKVRPTTKGRLVVAEVPPGQDGRVWSLRNYKAWEPIRTLNLPQLFSLSPRGLLVPTDAR